MRFVGRGHPAIRATHVKTLEFSPDAQITARATCVVAVGTETAPLAPMAGRVRISIAAGGHRFELEADANSSWDPRGPAVLRRSPLRRPGTFATGATASSADLPRGLVNALLDPQTVVTVDVVDVPDERPTVVLYAADPTLAQPDQRLRAELDRADRVVAQDAAARRLLGARVSSGSRDPTRMLVVATADLPRAPAACDADVDVVGLPAVLAAAAASPTGGALVLAGRDDDVRTLLRTTPATSRLALHIPADDLPDLLRQARERRGSSACVMAQEFGRPVRLPDGAAPGVAGAHDVAVCLDAATPDDAIDPAVRAAVDALVTDGIATRTVARALAALTGWNRRRAYDVVVTWTPRSARGPAPDARDVSGGYERA